MANETVLYSVPKDVDDDLVRIESVLRQIKGAAQRGQLSGGEFGDWVLFQAAYAQKAVNSIRARFLKAEA